MGGYGCKRGSAWPPPRNSRANPGQVGILISGARTRMAAPLKLIAAIAVFVSATVLTVTPATPAPEDGSDAGTYTPLPRSAVAGLGYLARHQHANGGWNSDASGRQADLSNTSIAGLAFLRGGGSMTKGTVATVLARTEEFVTNTVAGSDDQTLLHPSNGDPLVQADLGPGIDAILAAWFLAELLDQGVPREAEERVRMTLRRLVNVIGFARTGGMLDHRGSKVLSLALAARALRRASDCGIAIDEAVLQGLIHEANAMARTGTNAAADFYQCAAVAGTLLTGSDALPPASPPTAFIRLADQQARDINGKPVDTARNRNSLADVSATVSRTVANPAWQGVSASGGEISIATMFIGDMLHATRSKAWPMWNERVGQGFAQTQNRDGSWTGTSCINGRVFCTASAVLATLSDRISSSTNE
jgi:hypothetical protein